ncbi:hypothetical protein VR45_23925 [Streptomyces sp. NRRL S-495]|nr:hypothetical protein VR45_23925 [Streptomyces sp. NRRL S-495]
MLGLAVGLRGVPDAVAGAVEAVCPGVVAEAEGVAGAVLGGGVAVAARAWSVGAGSWTGAPAPGTWMPFTSPASAATSGSYATACEPLSLPSSPRNTAYPAPVRAAITLVPATAAATAIIGTVPPRRRRQPWPRRRSAARRAERPSAPAGCPVAGRMVVRSSLFTCARFLCSGPSDRSDECRHLGDHGAVGG